MAAAYWLLSTRQCKTGGPRVAAIGCRIGSKQARQYRLCTNFKCKLSVGRERKKRKRLVLSN